MLGSNLWFGVGLMLLLPDKRGLRVPLFIRLPPWILARLFGTVLLVRLVAPETLTGSLYDSLSYHADVDLL